MSEMEKNKLINSAIEATEIVTREGLIIQEKNTIESEIEKSGNEITAVEEKDENERS